jgi:hypothetical protein
MTPRILAAIFAAAALPVAAQTSTLRTEARPAALAQQKQEEAAKAATPASLRDRAKLAKTQNKQGRKTPREKVDKQKKAAAS